MLRIARCRTSLAIATATPAPTAAATPAIRIASSRTAIRSCSWVVVSRNRRADCAHASTDFWNAPMPRLVESRRTSCLVPAEVSTSAATSWPTPGASGPAVSDAWTASVLLGTVTFSPRPRASASPSVGSQVRSGGSVVPACSLAAELPFASSSLATGREAGAPSFPGGGHGLFLLVTLRLGVAGTTAFARRSGPASARRGCPAPIVVMHRVNGWLPPLADPLPRPPGGPPDPPR